MVSVVVITAIIMVVCIVVKALTRTKTRVLTNKGELASPYTLFFFGFKMKNGADDAGGRGGVRGGCISVNYIPSIQPGTSPYHL